MYWTPTIIDIFKHFVNIVKFNPHYGLLGRIFIWQLRKLRNSEGNWLIPSHTLYRHSSTYYFAQPLIHLLMWGETQRSFMDIASPEALFSGDVVFLRSHTAHNWSPGGRVGDFLTLHWHFQTIFPPFSFTKPMSLDFATITMFLFYSKMFKQNHYIIM